MQSWSLSLALSLSLPENTLVKLDWADLWGTRHEGGFEASRRRTDMIMRSGVEGGGCWLEV